MNIWICIAYFAFLCGVCNGMNMEPNFRCLVRSSSGSYRGLYNSSLLLPSYFYCAYTDIQYATAGRFERPTLAKPLDPSMIYDATEDTKQCPQHSQITPNDTSPMLTEDCLYLNVFTPQTGGEEASVKPRAVIVFIHGGGFVARSKSRDEFSPDYLIVQDIIIVTINYRLSVLGFMSLGIEEIGGNMGLRDQIEALKWVQLNIRSFGGDPERVTIMGESAGAISTYILPLSPLTRGLLSRVIVESAVITTTMNVDVIVKTSTKYFTVKFAVFVGYEGDTNKPHAILSFLLNLSTLQLINGFSAFIQHLMETDETFIYNLTPFGPSLDSDVPDAVLPEPLQELGKKCPPYEIIIGCNNGDGNFYFTDPLAIAQYVVNDHLDLFLIGDNLIYGKNNDTLQKSLTEVRHYFNPTGQDHLVNISVNIATYFSFNNLYKLQIPIYQQSFYNNKIYLYEYVFTGGFEAYKQLLLGPYAKDVPNLASHLAELQYLFFVPMFFQERLNITEVERDLICKLTSWWGNFAKTGNPNKNEYDYSQVCISGIEWGSTTPTQDNYLRIGDLKLSSSEFISNRKIFQNEHTFFEQLLKFAENN